MDEKRWESYFGNKKAIIGEMQEKLDTAKKIFDNIANTNCLSDRGLSLIKSKNNYLSTYTEHNKEILKKDRVYNKLEEVRKIVGKYAGSIEYLALFRQIDELKETIAERTMARKQYHFIRRNSLEFLAAEVLGRKLAEVH